ncbi:MAG: transporter substrate-binding domain-containing protein [Oscillospiraceae bacterium]|nr:transporter substrate-binding domain-containing protein [Oscillospiraceae bacterium]
MKKIVAFVMAAAMCLSLCACGAKPAASDLEAIKAKGEMVIGYTVYEPMNYTDENGVFTGFDTELAIAVCEKLGVTPKFQEIVWETKEVELNAGSIDCVWNGLTIDEDRKAAMEITDPYVVNAQVVVMLADKEYNNTSDLAGKNVCAEQGSAGQTTIEGDDGLKQATFVPKTVQTDCLMEVAAGTCDAAVLDITLANAMIGEGTDYANLAIKDQLAEEFYGVAFRKGSDAAAATNAAFAELIADGTMGALAEKYGLTLAQ